MLSNLGNILLFLNVILSLSIIYTANKNLKISFRVNNLLKQKVEIAHFYQNKYYTTQEYDPGRSFSVSIQFNN